MILKTLIVDDELMARKAMERLCSKSEFLEIVGISENAEDALTLLEKEKVDLIFLDIEMPGLSGLELLDKIQYMPQVVFTTSNIEYAYEAYEYDVTDFIKKPVSQPRFLKSLEKVLEYKNRLDAVINESAKNEIYIKTDGRYIRIPFLDILYFENVGDYVKLNTENTGNHIIYGTLKSIDARLKHPRFLKVHRSFIVNLDKIKDIQDNTLVIEKKVIPISRAHKPILISSLNLL